jgi:predicted Fe-S protein YdhL (DUF1289 family)
MEDIKRYTRCILPATIAGITFDESGVCNHCKRYEADFKDWTLLKKGGRKSLKGRYKSEGAQTSL